MTLEKKIVKTEKLALKDLYLEEDKILDEDGFEVDLNKAVKMAFENGMTFDFTVQSKSNESKILEDGDGDANENDC